MNVRKEGRSGDGGRGEVVVRERERTSCLDLEAESGRDRAESGRDRAESGGRDRAESGRDRAESGLLWALCSG